MTKADMLIQATKMVHELRNELISYGFKVFPVRKVLLSTRCTNRFGQCRYNTRFNFLTNKQDIESVDIQITDLCFNNTSDCLKSTILHELIHAMPDGQGHRKAFHDYAKKISKIYNVAIDTRATSEETKLANKYVKSVGRGVHKRRKLATRYVVVCNCCGNRYTYKKTTRLIKALLAKEKNHGYHCPCGSYDLALVEDIV